VLYNIFNAITDDGSTLKDIVQYTSFSEEEIRFYLKILVKLHMVTFGSPRNSSGMIIKSVSEREIVYIKIE